jgi:hypothetical protein
MLIKQALDALPLYDTRRAVARSFSPSSHLVKAKTVLDGGPVDGNDEFRHWSDFRSQFIGTELGDCERDGPIERFRLYFNVMRDSIGVGKRDPAGVHGAII